MVMLLSDQMVIKSGGLMVIFTVKTHQLLNIMTVQKNGGLTEDVIGLTVQRLNGSKD
jgi:hypothetical protein